MGADLTDSCKGMRRLQPQQKVDLYYFFKNSYNSDSEIPTGCIHTLNTIIVYFSWFCLVHFVNPAMEGNKLCFMV